VELIVYCCYPSHPLPRHGASASLAGSSRERHVHGENNWIRTRVGIGTSMPRRGERGRPMVEPGSVTFVYHSCSLSNKLLVTAEGESFGS
jgi:hypothetical protein